MENKLRSINFSDGYKTFCINNDPERVIRFNPADVDIIQRFNQVMKELKEEKNSLPDISLNPDGTAAADDSTALEQAAQELERFNQVIREKLHTIFKSDVYDAVFDGQSPFAIVGDGQMLFEAFMDSAFAVIEDEVESNIKARVEKYTAKYKGRKGIRPEAGTHG